MGGGQAFQIVPSTYQERRIQFITSPNSTFKRRRPNSQNGNFLSVTENDVTGGYSVHAENFAND